EAPRVTVEERAEDARRVHPGHAQPLDVAAGSDERGRLAVREEGVLGDGGVGGLAEQRTGRERDAHILTVAPERTYCHRARPEGGRKPSPSQRFTPYPANAPQLPYSPYASMRRSHTSLMVGNAGTACHSLSIGTWPAMAMVAEWSSSWTPGPVKVAPTTTLMASSTTSWLVPDMPLPSVDAPDTSPV